MPNATLAPAMSMYPRGFLGAIPRARVEPIPRPFEERLRQRTLSLNLRLARPNASNLVPNYDVEELFDKLINGLDVIGDFGYREKLLVTAIGAWGTTNFKTWYDTQGKSPAFGKLHQQFMDDCLAFIMTGERGMRVEVWNQLLTHDNSVNVKQERSDIYRAFFGNNGTYSTSVTEVIQRWVSWPGGFEDLMLSLHVFFGKY